MAFLEGCFQKINLRGRFLNRPFTVTAKSRLRDHDECPPQPDIHVSWFREGKQRRRGLRIPGVKTGPVGERDNGD